MLTLLVSYVLNGISYAFTFISGLIMLLLVVYKDWSVVHGVLQFRNLLNRCTHKELQSLNLHLNFNCFVLEEICIHLFMSKVNHTSDASLIMLPLLPFQVQGTERITL